MAFTVHAVDRIKLYSLKPKLLSTNYVPSGVRISRRSPQFRSGQCGRRRRHAAAHSAGVEREPRPSIPEAQEASCNASDWATTTSSIPAAAQPLHLHRRSPALLNGEITHDLQGKGCLISLPGRWRELRARGQKLLRQAIPAIRTHVPRRQRSGPTPAVRRSPSRWRLRSRPSASNG